MASLWRVAARQGCRYLQANQTLRQRLIQPTCLISTSKKNKDAAALNETIHNKAQEQRTDEDDPNWISYGYSLTNRDEDHFAHKITMFVFITCLVCFGGMYLAYFPDFRLREWALREGYLELARREKEGLPLVDRNLIDPEKMAATLPSDEELGDTEIIL